MNRCLAPIAVLAVALHCGSVRAAVYHVSQRSPQASDAAPGTAERPWKTISKAAEAMQPGDTAMIHAGVYREHVRPGRSGTASAPITYQSAPGEEVVLTGADTPTATTLLPDTHVAVLRAERIVSGMEEAFALVREAAGVLPLRSDAKLLALDGTANKDKLGANAVLGVSLEEITTALVYTSFNLTLPPSGEISLPVGLVPGRIVEIPRGMSTSSPRRMLATIRFCGQGTSRIFFPSQVEFRSTVISSTSASPLIPMRSRSGSDSCATNQNGLLGSVSIASTSATRFSKTSSEMTPSRRSPISELR